MEGLDAEGSRMGKQLQDREYTKFCPTSERTANLTDAMAGKPGAYTYHGTTGEQVAVRKLCRVSPDTLTYTP